MSNNVNNTNENNANENNGEVKGNKALAAAKARLRMDIPAWQRAGIVAGHIGLQVLIGAAGAMLAISLHERRSRNNNALPEPSVEAGDTQAS